MFELLYKLHFVTVWYCRNIVWCANFVIVHYQHIVLQIDYRWTVDFAWRLYFADHHLFCW